MGVPFISVGHGDDVRLDDRGKDAGRQSQTGDVAGLEGQGQDMRGNEQRDAQNESDEPGHADVIE